MTDNAAENSVHHGVNGRRRLIGRLKPLVSPRIRRWMRLRSMLSGFDVIFGITFGSLRRMSPFTQNCGYDRGLPVDRHYIEGFLSRHAESIRGRVLEIGDNAYTRRYGSTRVTKSDVLHLRAAHPGVTIVADLARAGSIPSNSFDCVVLTQTLQYIFDVNSAVATLYRILAPGGVVLATVPGILPIVGDEWRESACWSFTPRSARLSLASSFGDENVEVVSYGNMLSSIAYVAGLASEDLRRHELDFADESFPLVVAVKATKV